jgi:hypothetical protein
MALYESIESCPVPILTIVLGFTDKRVTRLVCKSWRDALPKPRTLEGLRDFGSEQWLDLNWESLLFALKRQYCPCNAYLCHCLPEWKEVLRTICVIFQDCLVDPCARCVYPGDGDGRVLTYKEQKWSALDYEQFIRAVFSSIGKLLDAHLASNDAKPDSIKNHYKPVITLLRDTCFYVGEHETEMSIGDICLVLSVVEYALPTML